MDNISHSLAGWMLSRAAGSVRPAGTTLALVLASNLPDIDLVLLLRGDADYLFYHRGLSHSLVGLAALPPVLAAGLWWGLGRRTSFRWLWLLCAAGAALHVLYDLATSWGTLLLYPFDLRRFALDSLFIVDFVTWGIPLLAILYAWRRPARSRRAAALALALLALYGVASVALHRRARAAVVASEAAARRQPAEAYAIPRPGAPLRWAGFALAPADAPEPQITRYSVTGPGPTVGPPARIERGLADPWARRALASRPGQGYLWWSRIPLARVAHAPDGAVMVTLHDLRYARTLGAPIESGTPFALRLRLDPATGALLDARW